MAHPGHLAPTPVNESKSDVSTVVNEWHIFSPPEPAHYIVGYLPFAVVHLYGVRVARWDRPSDTGRRND